MTTPRKLLKNKIKYSIKIKTAFSSDIKSCYGYGFNINFMENRILNRNKKCEQ